MTTREAAELATTELSPSERKLYVPEVRGPPEERSVEDLLAEISDRLREISELLQEVLEELRERGQ
jgi:hypothetical protein